jgi:polyisoprenyl-teichoic acid--peptidoglycan teichoic acid transferase
VIQAGIRRLASTDPRNLRRLASLFAKYFDYDRTLRRRKQLLSLGKIVLRTASKPVREIRFRTVWAPDGVNLLASRAMLRASVDEFLAAGEPRPRRAGRRIRRLRAPHLAHVAGLIGDRTEGENQTILAARRVRFPLYFPTRRLSRGGYVGHARVYRLRDEAGRLQRAYRLVLSTGLAGEYYGVQGMTWRRPPILAGPFSTRTVNGRRLEVFADGARVRRVAWRTKRAVYWVSNTLTRSLSNDQMLAIAASLTRFH